MTDAENKTLLDITASIETRLRRAGITLSKHIDNINGAVVILSAMKQFVVVKGVEVNLEEMQEGVLDIAEILDGLEEDIVDILQYHKSFAEAVANSMEKIINNRL